jgi:hypothetical protein
MSCLCFPQFCSTRAELVNNPHHHSHEPTVIGPRLSAWICQPFCCQRTFALILSERSSTSLKPSGRYPLNSEGFATSSFKLRARKIKNPASSAGYMRHFASGASTRSSTKFYPVLVKNLTIGSTSGLRLILRWEDASSTRL